MLRAAAGNTKQVQYIGIASYGSDTATTTITINKPTGTVEGDLMIAVMVSDEARTWTGDTDWTEVRDGAPRIAYKVAGASEPSSYTFTCALSRRSRGVILTYRNAVYDTIGAVDTSSPYSPAGITMSDTGRLIGVICKSDTAGTTFTLPSSMTSRTNSTIVTPRIAIGDEAVSAGATGSRTFTSSSTTNIAAVLLGIKVN